MTTNPPESPEPPDQTDNPVASVEPTDERHPTTELPSEEPIGPAPSGPSAQTSPPPPPPPPLQSPGPGAAGPGWGSGGPAPGYDQAGRPAGTSRLQRSTSDRVLTGVCGGLGRHTGIDPILFRIGFVALVFAAGTGLLFYFVLALLMPRDDGQQAWPRQPGARRVGNDASGPPGGTGSAYGPPAPPVPAGPRSPVPGVTLAVLLIGVGVIAFGERFGNWSVGPSTYFAIAVTVVGIALLVSAFGPWRRSKAGLIVLGLVLSVCFSVTSAVDSRGGFDDASFGERTYIPVSAEQVRDSYRVLMGQGTLDLSDLQFSAADPTEIRIEVTMGNFEILVPRDADVRLDGDATFGSVSAFGDRELLDGYYPGVGEEPAAGENDPELILTIDVRFGNAEVTRVG